MVFADGNGAGGVEAPRSPGARFLRGTGDVPCCPAAGSVSIGRSYPGAAPASGPREVRSSDARSPRNGREKQSRCSRPGETEHGDGLSSSASRAAKRSLLQRETGAVRVLALTARINFGFRCCPRKISVTGFTTNKSKIISILTLKLLKW